ATTPALAQLPGRAGCVLYFGEFDRGCARSRFEQASAIAVSPTGHAALAGFLRSDALVLLRRNPPTLALTPVAGSAGCIAARGVSHAVKGCAAGRRLNGPVDIAFSPGGLSAYVASANGLAVLAVR
ncbi:MAG: hypothetical protein JWM71_2, partial [Solirubrobacteraceae bacterium]|nr:hypothetical protein [Solirubrobacteraceae bacterium]